MSSAQTPLSLAMNEKELEEEITALESIYGTSSETLRDGSNPLPGILFSNKERCLKYFCEYLDGILEIKVRIPFGYPSDVSSLSFSAWYFEIHHLKSNNHLSPSSCISLPSKTFKQLKELIETRALQKPILFELFDTITSCTFDTDRHLNAICKTKDSGEAKIDNTCDFDGDKVFGILHGEPIVDRKSVFQAHVCRVNSVDQVNKIIKWLLSNPKISKATHNIWSYRLFKERDTSSSGSSFPIGYDIISQDHDSDGETAAGSRLQHLLNVTNAKNVFVMVTRWYGGIQLGPDRFKHINNVARYALEKSGLIQQENVQKKSVLTKRKSKTNS
ncbi:hypothetical protein HWI79_1519 [Cryptosporidium felis]|nr:hypothetical protein HWI79_1519 [Cryptosporidium felis]